MYPSYAPIFVDTSVCNKFYYVYDAFCWRRCRWLQIPQGIGQGFKIMVSDFTELHTCGKMYVRTIFFEGGLISRTRMSLITLRHLSSLMYSRCHLSHALCSVLAILTATGLCSTTINQLRRIVPSEASLQKKFSAKHL